jgi:hypothetical protein
MAFLGKKFPWNGIPWSGVPWKKFSLLWRSSEKFFLVVAFLGTAFLGKKIPWSVVQPIICIEFKFVENCKKKRFLPREFSHFFVTFSSQKISKEILNWYFLGSVIELENCIFLLKFKFSRKLFSLLEIVQLNLSEAKPNNVIKLNEKTLFGNQEK